MIPTYYKLWSYWVSLLVLALFLMFLPEAGKFGSVVASTIHTLIFHVAVNYRRKKKE